MAENKFMGTFESQGDVLSKIEDLKNQGVPEDHMYVMAEDKEQLSLVRGRTDVDYKTAEGGFMDKFVAFLAGDDPTREAISRMGVDTRETDRYYHDVKNGKILLFVDQDLGNQYEEEKTTGFSQVKQDELIGAGGGGVAVDPASSLGADPYLTADQINDNKTRDTTGIQDRSDAQKDDWQDTQTIDEGEASGFQRSNNHQTDEEVRIPGGTPATGDRGHVIDSSEWDSTNHTREEDVKHVSADDYETNRDHDFASDQEERMKLHEEKLNIDKNRVQTGEVNVGKHVVEDKQSIEVPIERDEVYVERRPVDQESVMRDEDAFKDTDGIHIPIREEQVEVNKKDVVREEIVVGKRKVQDTETINETTRREEADIDEDSQFPKYHEKDGPLNL